MADIIYSSLKTGDVFSVHRVELKDDKEALCGTVVYVRCGQIPNDRDDLDEAILSALQSQYSKSIDNPKYFTKDSLNEEQIMDLCGVDIHKGSNIKMNIHIKTDVPVDISGWSGRYIAELNIPLVAYDIYTGFTTESISSMSILPMEKKGQALKDLANNLFIYQDFMH